MNKYQYNNNEYCVVDKAKMKLKVHPVSLKHRIANFMLTALLGKAWVDCVVYKSLKDEKIYIREKEDFETKFTPVATPTRQEQFEAFGWKTPKPCDICGAAEARISPRFTYNLCIEHFHIPDQEIQRTKHLHTRVDK